MNPAPHANPAKTPTDATAPSRVGVGIDIECADNLPWSGDPWLEPFYRENFTEAEIAYCARQANPRLWFCGLWSAKEAALKCDPALADLRPIEIEIGHTEKGQPELRLAKARPTHSGGWTLSISQAGQTCVAVCLKLW